MTPVQRAEVSRIQQQFQDALRMTDPFMVLPRQVPPSEIHEYMKAWRIRSTTYGSMATRTRSGDVAAQFLSQERNIFTTYYQQPHVQTAAVRMVEDNGTEYLMQAEMDRDYGLYFLKLASLTGNALFLDQSITAFDRALSHSPEESSVHNLALLERFGVQRRRRQRGDFSQLTLAYQQVIEKPSGGWDRKAAASWMYAQEALAAKKIGAGIEGIFQLWKATKIGKEKNNVGFIKYIHRRLEAKRGEKARRKSFNWTAQEIQARLLI